MDRQRIDKWLWHARVVRTRTGAATLVTAGLVRLNGPFTPIGEPAVRTQSYVLADLDGTIAIGRTRWMLDWELHNLFNTRYPEVRSSGYLNPGAPRVLRMAIRFQP